MADAKLTIVAEGRGAQRFLGQIERSLDRAAIASSKMGASAAAIEASYRAAQTQAAALNRTIDAGAKGAQRHAAVAKTAAGHYQNTAGAAQAANRVVASLTQDTRVMAGVAKSMTRHHQESAAAISDADRRMKSLVSSARAAERASKGIRPRFAASAAGRGAGASRATPPPLLSSAGASRGIGATLLSNVRSVGPALGSVFTEAGSKLGPSANKSLVKFVARVPGLIGGAILGGVQGVIGGVTSIIGGALRGATRLFEVGLKAAAVAGAVALTASVALAAKEQPLERSFGDIVESRGLGEQEEVFRRVSDAADGTISRLQLYQNTNRAVFLGAAKSTEELEILTVAGRRLGEAMGRSANEGFEDLSLGIGRQSRLILDNLGIIVRVEDAQKRYAKSVGTTTDKLSEEEKALVFRQAAFQAIESRLASLGDEQDTATKSLARARVSASDLASTLGEDLLPEITGAANAWADFVSDLSPDQIRDLLSKGINAARTGLGDLTDLLTGEGSALRGNIAGLGGAIFDAISNPSGPAFQIVLLRGQQLLGTLLTEFEVFWEKTKVFGINAFRSVIEFGLDNLDDAIRTIFTAGLPDFIKDRLPSFDFDLGTSAIGKAAFDFTTGSREDRAAELAETVKGIRGEGGNPELEAKIKLLEQAVREGNELRKKERESEGGTGPGLGADGPDIGILISKPKAALEELAKSATDASNATEKQAAQLAVATAKREAIQAEEAAEKAAKKAAVEAAKEEEAARRELARALGKEQRGQEKALRALEREASKREEFIREIGESRSDLERAVDGFGPVRDIFEKLGDTAAKLREFPEAIEDVTLRIKDTDLAIQEANRAFLENTARARLDFAESLKRQSTQFLFGQDQDGDSVRVRATRRRAQREQRRRNKELTNGAFRSRGFEDAFGNLSGLQTSGALFGSGADLRRVGGIRPDDFFGAGASLGRDPRNTGVIDQRRPALEQALAQLIQDDGSTQQDEFDAELVRAFEEKAAQLRELREQRKKLTEELKAIEAERGETIGEVIAFEKEAIATVTEAKKALEKDKQEIAANKAEIERLKKQIEQLTSRRRT